MRPPSSRVMLFGVDWRGGAAVTGQVGVVEVVVGVGAGAGGKEVAGVQASFTMGQAERFHTTCPDSPPCFLLIIFNNKNTTYSVVYRLLSSCDIA